jgi:hypothetical protein
MVVHGIGRPDCAGIGHARQAGSLMDALGLALRVVDVVVRILWWIGAAVETVIFFFRDFPTFLRKGVGTWRDHDLPSDRKPDSNGTQP